MNTPTVPEAYKRRLQAHFAFTGVPFRKNMVAAEMFDSRGQRDLLHALVLWMELRGICLVTGPSGVGKSITLRRFIQDLDPARYNVVYVPNTRTTETGFLRSLNRALDLPMRAHNADLFDQAQRHLTAHGANHGPHTVLVLDDAEGVRPALLDILRRLTSFDLDAEDRFSVLISATDELLRTLRDPGLEPFVTRIGFASSLKPFSLEDTRNYVAFHIARAGARDRLFSEDAVKRMFLASQGNPRRINQIAVHALIQAAVMGHDAISGDFLAAQLAAHPLYDTGSNA